MEPPRALQMPELVLEILEYFGYAHADISHRRALAALARSCKTLSTVALDLLWKKVFTMVNLFHVIPSFSYDDTTMLYGFSGIIQHDDWVRFDSYASRIQGIHEEDTIQIEDFVFIRTAQHLRGRPMFPLLRELSLCGAPIILPFLLSPSLRSIDLIDDPPYRSQMALIQSIYDGSPSLQEFRFFGQLERGSYEILSQFPSLRCMEVDEAGVIPIDIIASFKSVTKLELTTVTPQTFLSVDQKPFGLQALHQLKITAPPLLAVSMLKAFVKSPIQALYLTFGRTLINNGSLTEWTDAITVISLWASTLSHVQLQYSRSEKIFLPDGSHTLAPPPIVTVIKGFSYLHTLLKCHQIKNLIVNNCLTTLLSDDDFIQLSAAWPKLEALILRGTVPEGPGPLASMESLKIIATQLPKLRIMNVPLDLTEISLTEPRIQASHQLKSLDFERVFADDNLIPLARLLDGLFPSLQVKGKCQTRTGVPAGYPTDVLNSLLYLCREGGSNGLQVAT